LSLGLLPQHGFGLGSRNWSQAENARRPPTVSNSPIWPRCRHGATAGVLKPAIAAIGRSLVGRRALAGRLGLNHDITRWAML
jgi:hypothetical protein